MRKVPVSITVEPELKEAWESEALKEGRSLASWIVRNLPLANEFGYTNKREKSGVDKTMGE